MKRFGEAWADAEYPPRQWQAHALPVTIDSVRRRKNSIISAVTGSGKSVLLTELVWMALAKLITRDDLCVVVSTPTQDLVKQLSATMAARIGHKLTGQFYGRKKQADRKVIVTCNPSVGKLVEALKTQGKRVALLICDEVHKSEGEQIREAIELLQPAARIGFTATAFRADEGETLSLWDEIAYQYTLGDAWRDKVLVPFTPIPWDGVGDDKDTDGWCLAQMREQPGPGVVSSLSIPDCEGYAQWLTAQGFPAEPVHSKRGDPANASALAKLAVGQLRCVVHVAMLSEGVDIPALRWIALRRPVGSRVRFVQEVGRVLRVMHEVDQWGPKTHAYVIDPHNLFDEHGIAHPAALGEPPPKQPKEEKQRDSDELPPLPGLAPEMPAMQRVSIASAWARRLLIVMQADGLALPTADQWADGKWRQGRSTPKQRQALERMAWAARYIPQPHRDAIKWSINARNVLRSGACSDLLDVLRAVADASDPARKSRKHWKWPKAVHIPPLDIDSV